MREEEEANWFARWEEQLPTPEELTPLSQTLITPDLALALDILPHGSPEQLPAPAGPDEPARTLKRPRLVWTPQLHKRFVDAVAHLGIKNAVPKTIMQLMNVDGLTRENVASHLQKYRLYLKRMQGGLPSSSPAPAPAPADDHLFATAPLPHHFLARGPPLPRPADAGMPFVPVAALQHRQQMAAVAQHYYHQRHAGHMGSPPAGGGGGFEHGYLARQQQQQGIQRVVVGGTGGAGMVPPSLAGSYGGDLRSDAAGAAVGRRQELTLFPTGF